MIKIALLSNCIFLFLSSCITLKRPADEPWATPVDLKLDNQSLKNTTIKLQCGKGANDSLTWTAASLQACKRLSKLFTDLGAKILDAKEFENEDVPTGPAPTHDFVVTYIDRGWESDYGGWTIPLFLLSFSLFPCVEDSTSFAELRVEQPGITAQSFRESLKLDVRRVYGIVALPLMARHSQAKDNELTRGFFQYLQNKVYLYSFKKSQGLL